MLLFEESYSRSDTVFSPDSEQSHKPLRILMISSAYFPKSDGSVLAVTGLVRSLIAGGNQVVLVTRGYRHHKGGSALEPNVIRVNQIGNSMPSKFLFSISSLSRAGGSRENSTLT